MAAPVRLLGPMPPCIGTSYLGGCQGTGSRSSDHHHIRHFMNGHMVRRALVSSLVNPYIRHGWLRRCCSPGSPILYPLIEEYTLNHIENPYIIQDRFPNQGVLGSLGATQAWNPHAGTAASLAAGVENNSTDSTAAPGPGFLDLSTLPTPSFQSHFIQSIGLLFWLEVECS